MVVDWRRHDSQRKKVLFCAFISRSKAISLCNHVFKTADRVNAPMPLSSERAGKS